MASMPACLFSYKRIKKEGQKSIVREVGHNTRFLPERVRNWPCFCSVGSDFWNTGHFFQNCLCLVTKLSHWQKIQKLHTYILSFYPKGPKMSFFSLCGQHFPRYGPIFKIAIFGHEIWPLAKVPEVAHILSFYSTHAARGQNWAYFHSMGHRYQGKAIFTWVRLICYM